MEQQDQQVTELVEPTPQSKSCMVNSQENQIPMLQAQQAVDSHFQGLKEPVNQIQVVNDYIHISLNNQIPYRIAKQHMYHLRISLTRQHVPNQTIIETQKAFLSSIYYACSSQLYSTASFSEKCSLDQTFGALKLDKFKIELPSIITDIISQIGDFSTYVGKVKVINKEELITEWTTASQYIQTHTVDQFVENIDNLTLTAASDLQHQIRVQLSKLWDDEDNRKITLQYQTPAQNAAYVAAVERWVRNLAPGQRVNASTLATQVRNGNIAKPTTDIEVLLPSVQQFANMTAVQRDAYTFIPRVNLLFQYITDLWNRDQAAHLLALRGANANQYNNLQITFIDVDLATMIATKLQLINSYENHLQYIRIVFQTRKFFPTPNGSEMQFISKSKDSQQFIMNQCVPVQAILLGFSLNCCKKFAYRAQFTLLSKEFIKIALDRQVKAERRKPP